MIDAYELAEALGYGPIGRVYAATKQDSAAFYALKLFHEHIHQEQAALRSIRHAAALLAAAELQGVMPIFDLAFSQKQSYLVMPRDTGGSLASLWSRYRDRKRRIDPQTVMGYIGEVATVLQQLHELPLAHGNLKPGNIRIRHAEQAGTLRARLVLSDAVFADVVTSQHLMLRDSFLAQFAAPEQFNGTTAAASDQYALGVIAWMWFVGALPFSPRSFAALKAAKDHPADLVARWAARVPTALLKVLARALAADPEERYPSVLAFKDALKQAVADAPDSGWGVNPEQPLVRADFHNVSRRQFLIGSVLGAGSIAVTVGGIEIIKRLPFSLRSSEASHLVASTPPPRTYGILKQTLELSAHAKRVNAIAWAPSGQLFASASDDHSVRLWNGITGQVQKVYTGHAKAVTGIKWSPDGTLLASCSLDGTVRIWSRQSDQSQLLLTPGHTPLNGVDWFPDGKRVAAITQGNQLLVWDSSTGEAAAPITFGDQTTMGSALAVAPDGRAIAASDLVGTIGVYHVATEVWFTTIATSKAILSVAYHPTGTMLASGGAARQVNLWNPSNGGALATFSGMAAQIYQVAWSSDGKLIAAGDEAGEVVVWNADSQLDQIWSTVQVPGVARALGWDHSGAYLAVGTSSGIVWVFQSG